MSERTLDDALGLLTDGSRARPFDEQPDEPNYWYAVWLDEPGARELTEYSPEPIQAGIVYAGECVTQSLRRHLMHNNIGSLTLMKSLAALLREPWSLRAERKGEHLVEPGRRKLLDWMSDHLTATAVPRPDGVKTRDMLAALDPPMGLQGWRPERTPNRVFIRKQRAILDGGR